MTQTLMVVKLGGSILSALSPSWWDDAALVARRNRLILVHGWSRQLREWQERRQVTPVFRISQHGYRSRLTDDTVIGDIRSVAAGLRCQISQQFADRGVPSRGMDAADESLLTAEVIPQRWWVDGGLRGMENLVGPVSGVNADAIGGLLGELAVLVLTPLARSAHHRYVNVDADHAAAAIAITAGAGGLVLVTDVSGVLVDGLPVRVLRPAEIAGLASHVNGGMRKKLQAAADATSGGVSPVVIGRATITDLVTGRVGTRMVA